MPVQSIIARIWLNKRIEEELCDVRTYLTSCYDHRKNVSADTMSRHDMVIKTLLSTFYKTPNTHESFNNRRLCADILALHEFSGIGAEERNTLLLLERVRNLWTHLQITLGNSGIKESKKAVSIGAYMEFSFFLDASGRLWEIREHRERKLFVRLRYAPTGVIPITENVFGVNSDGFFNNTPVRPVEFFSCSQSAYESIGQYTCAFCGAVRSYLQMLYAKHPTKNECLFFCAQRQACISAWEDFNEPEAVKQSIKSYSYKPSPKFCYDKESDKLFYGVEIEVENVGFIDGEQPVKNKRAAYELIKKYPFIYCKSDSSIQNGFEIITEPMSFEWMLKHKQELCGFMSDIRKMGFRSFEPGTCGMHVHINRTHFNTHRLYNFIKFFWINREFITQLSHRNMEQIQQYANFNVVGNANLSFVHRYGPEACIEGRHGALNLQNQQTVEVRVFRGTLDFSMFMRNIEFVHALCDYVPWNKQAANNELNIQPFVQYVAKNKNMFVEFYKYLTVNEGELVL